jgi:hypothetical protein
LAQGLREEEEWLFCPASSTNGIRLPAHLLLGRSFSVAAAFGGIPNAWQATILSSDE